ncbi:uncharacterized protein LOC142639378 [Castanea sativa]|uniref:uncharacterized protein LOC142639378 n=1 Tax=Castanea sativa TaxID=21020 RepID=UPI003F64A12F
MVSPTGGNPTLRIAHFLKPSVSSIDELPSPFHSTEPTISDIENLPLKLHFKGWHCTDEKWKILAEKWCPKTNTFIFSWGEATVTLEDMMALGGYSVLSPLLTKEMEEIYEILLEAHKTVSFVFPMPLCRIEKLNFPIAILLARGTRIALAPTILSSIYTDLGLLKEKLVASTKLDTEEVNLSYLPHRVALQFGIDQDLPGHVARYNMSPGIAWSHYSRSIGDAKLYIPPHLFEADVTMGYFEWWKQSMSSPKDEIKNFVTRPRDSKRILRVYFGNMENYNVFFPPSFSVERFKVDTVKETKLWEL